MNQKNFRQKLIVLHYFYPLPLNKLQRLLSLIDDLSNLKKLSVHELNYMLGITATTAEKLLQQFNLYENISIEAYLNERNIQCITYLDAVYPQRLKELYDAPAVLYACGDISLLSYNKIAVIGSRMATSYSRAALEQILPPLIEANYGIVSGFAKGADTIAHHVTIGYGGKTIAVLGSGFDHIYPKENGALFQEMASTQLVLSEFAPHFGPKKWHFPMRNRIISGLSEALLVTEAKKKSGTLITTEHALDQGKDVFVVPGPITSEFSLGTNHLIKEGAIPIWNGYQIVDELTIF